MARKTKETENPKESVVKEVAKKIKETVTKKKEPTKKESTVTSKKATKTPYKKDVKTVKKTSSKTSVKKEKAEKKSTKTAEPKKTVAKNSKTLVKEKTTKKESTKVAPKTVKKAESQKTTTAKVAPSTSKKSTSKNVKKATTTKKKTTVKKIKPENKKVDYDGLIKKDFSAEYYDLPFRYNQTIVKILAQTPSKLFVYWDISDSDRENLKKNFGEYFFQITKPVLIIHNKTMNYSFEVDIDDFANSWYLPIKDSNCDYQIELGRRPIPVNYSYMPDYNVEENGPIYPISDSYIYITSSNDLEAPNDRILFNNTEKIYFRNVKTNQIIEKDIKDFPFINKDNEFISIYEIYKELYKDVLSGEDFRYLDLTNPSSSGNPSSGSMSSKFM